MTAAVDEFEEYYAFGSGADFALGAMQAVYRKVPGARDVAKCGLHAACRFDDSSQLPLELKTVRLA